MWGVDARHSNQHRHCKVREKNQHCLAWKAAALLVGRGSDSTNEKGLGSEPKHPPNPKQSVVVGEVFRDKAVLEIVAGCLQPAFAATSSAMAGKLSDNRI